MSLVLDERGCGDWMEALDEWKALPGERGKLADKDADWLGLPDVLVRPTEDEPERGKEKEDIAPKSRSVETEL